MTKRARYADAFGVDQLRNLHGSLTFCEPGLDENPIAVFEPFLRCRGPIQHDVVGIWIPGRQLINPQILVEGEIDEGQLEIDYE